MKMFIIVLVLISSALGAIFFTLNTPEKVSPRTAVIEEKENLAQKINQNLSLIRRITKEGDIEEAEAFKLNSSYLLQEIKKNPTLSKNISSEYSELNTIVNNTILSIQTNRPQLSKEVALIKENIQKFDHKIKSIGLSELKSNWISLQKLHHEFLREPYENGFQTYQQTLKETKKIIEELYLDDEDEEFLFSFLDQYQIVLSTFHLVYKDVGLDQIREIKPLSYALKEKMQLNASLFAQSTL